MNSKPNLNIDEKCCGWSGPIDYYNNDVFDVQPGEIYTRKFLMAKKLRKMAFDAIFSKCPSHAVNRLQIAAHLNLACSIQKSHAPIGSTQWDGA